MVTEFLSSNRTVFSGSDRHDPFLGLNNGDVAGVVVGEICDDKRLADSDDEDTLSLLPPRG